MKYKIILSSILFSTSLFAGGTAEFLGIQRKVEVVQKALDKLKTHKDFQEHKFSLVDSESYSLVFYENDDLPSDNFLKVLSKELNCPLLRLGFYDADYWYYELYSKGKLLNRFSTHPKVLKSQDPRYKTFSYKADILLLVKTWGKVKSEEIKHYLLNHEKNEDLLFQTPKAYKTDEFEYGDIWQITDFMKKFGLNYPED